VNNRAKRATGKSGIEMLKAKCQTFMLDELPDPYRTIDRSHSWSDIEFKV
jgi:hypothetical protein